MIKGDQTRTKLIQTVVNLLKVKGYNGIGLQEIVRESKTPKGSLYFHFPNGKKELVKTAVKQVGEEINDLLKISFERFSDVNTVIKLVIDYFIDELKTSDFQKGCPVATTTMDNDSASDILQVQCGNSFRLWEKTITDHLITEGFSKTESKKKAMFLLSTIEGAIMLCQAYKSLEPLEVAAEYLSTVTS